VDGNFRLDLTAVFHHIDSAQTLSVFFPLLRRALVVDMRHGPQEGPLVRVMPMARSAADRLRSLKRLRPHLPRATDIVAIPWAGYVGNVVTSGVWERLVKRLEAEGGAGVVKTADAALEELRRIERHELALLLKGEQYETMWARKK
jgi:hypothetical protein